jgi:hypothetical protein
MRQTLIPADLTDMLWHVLTVDPQRQLRAETEADRDAGVAMVCPVRWRSTSRVKPIPDEAPMPAITVEDTTMSRASKRSRAASKQAAKATFRVRDAMTEQAHRDKRLSVDPVQRLIDGANRSASEHSLTLGEEQAAREIPRVSFKTKSSYRP